MGGDPITYLHGGVPGLRAGSQILPPSVTGKPTLLHYAEEVEGCVQRSDRVYLTTDFDMAALCAFTYPHGGIYKVVAEVMEPDPDATLPGYSFQAPSVTVIAVLQRGNPRKARLARRRANRKTKRPPTPPADDGGKNNG